MTILADNDTLGAKYRDLASACRPRRMTVTLDYKMRGGLHTVTTAAYDDPANMGTQGARGT